MKTEKQRELVNLFLIQLDDDDRRIYEEIIMFLSELGYVPRKVKSSISFKHELHNKQMAKIGLKLSNKLGVSPFFSLRFSACRGYSKRFDDIVSAAINKYPSRAAGCLINNCGFCAGNPFTHVYIHTIENGESKSHCGAYTLEIPDLSANDIDEIKKLIKEEHCYLMKYEANQTL
jgi:hypothetical protein